MKDYDVYLFDFDGTLVDSSASFYPVFRAGFAAIGIFDVSDEECDEFMHHNLSHDALSKGATKEQIPTFIQAVLDALDAPEVIGATTAFPGAFEVVKQLLSKGKRVGIVSSNTQKHIRLVLNHLGIGDIFETYTGSDTYKRTKPAPDPILIACQRMGVTPSEKVVYVGDSLQDVQAGRAAGVSTLLIDRKNAHPKQKGIRIETLNTLVL